MSLKRDIAYKRNSNTPIPIRRVYGGLPRLGHMASKPDTYKEVHTHGPAWSSQVVGGVLTHSLIQRPGKRTVRPLAPAWYQTVKTDSTDRLRRNKLLAAVKSY